MQPGKEYRIVFQGASLDVGNRGCCALAASFLQLAGRYKRGAHCSFLYGNASGGQDALTVGERTYPFDIIHCRMSLRSGLSRQILWIFMLSALYRFLPKRWGDKLAEKNIWLRTLRDADFVGEIRGGDSFSDIYGFRRFLVGMLPALIALFMGKDLIMLPQTYGPYSHFLSRHLASYVIRKSCLLLTRDRDSFQEIQRFLSPAQIAEKVRFCPDMAFVLEPDMPSNLAITPPLKEEAGRGLIGLNISGLLYRGGYTGKNMFGLKSDYRTLIDSLLAALLEKTNARILLVPHVFAPPEEDECRIGRMILDSLGGAWAPRVHLVADAYNQNQMKAIIGLCDFLIGSRMHACIAAISQGIPAVGVAYSRKFKGVFESVGLGGCVLDARVMDAASLLEAVLERYARREQIRKELEKTIPVVKEQVYQEFHSLFSDC